MGLIRSYFALFENFDGALGKFKKNGTGFAYNDTLAAVAVHQSLMFLYLLPYSVEVLYLRYLINAYVFSTS